MLNAEVIDITPINLNLDEELGVAEEESDEFADAPQ